MPRILLAEFKQETATFNPALTAYDDFAVLVGDELIRQRSGTQTELGGAIDVLLAEQCELVPTWGAWAVSGGPVATADLERLIDELRRAIQDVGTVDGIYVCLHGAMAGVSEPDPEGAVLQHIRARFPTTPLVASLDLHAVLTDRMVETADILVPYHTYPHTDHDETGRRAARNLLRLLEGAIRPTVARVPLPMLVRGDELLTATGLFGQAIGMCQAIEAKPEGLAAGVIIGNAFTDVPDLQSNVLVTCDGDQAAAQREAERIARFMWEHREQFQAQLTPLDEALRQAQAADGLVVFSDAADATASGAAGDSNAILQALLDSDFGGRSLVPIVDAPAVDLAFRSGVGASVETTLGGTRDTSRFEPLPVDVSIERLFEGGFVYEDGTRARSGRVAVLRSGPVTILVTERPVFVVGLRVFVEHGLDPREFDLVVVKSPNGFRTWYESIASLIVPVDVPGSTSANLKSLPYQHCVRPIFPLDENVVSPFESELS